MPEEPSAPSDAVEEEWVERHLDDEVGSVWDWESFAEQAFEDDDTVRDYPDRVWVDKIQDMLDKGGAPNKVYLALTLPLRQAHVNVTKPEEDEDGEITEFIESAMLKPKSESGMDTPIQLILSQMTHAIAVKRMYFEKVFTRRSDGKIVYSKVMWRPPEACELLRDKRTGKIKGFKQFVGSFQRDDADTEGFVEIPPERTFVYIHGQHRDPYYGISDLEATFWQYELKMKVLALWHLFLDRSALGKIVTYGQTQKDANERAKRMSELRSSGTVGMERSSPDEPVFDQIAPDNTANATFREMIAYLDSEMTGSVLANWADLASSTGGGSKGSSGSYALSVDQSSWFTKSREAVAQEMVQAINDHLIAPLVHVNFGPDAPVPQLHIEKLDNQQIETAMALLTTLGVSQTSLVPTEFLFLLIERLSVFLELDPEKVRTMIEEEEERLEERREQEQKTAELQTQMQEQGIATQAAGQTPAQAAKQGGQSKPGTKTQAAVNVATRATQGRTATSAANTTKNSSSVADSGKAQQAARKPKGK